MNFQAVEKGLAKFIKKQKKTELLTSFSQKSKLKQPKINKSLYGTKVKLLDSTGDYLTFREQLKKNNIPQIKLTEKKKVHSLTRKSYSELKKKYDDDFKGKMGTPWHINKNNGFRELLSKLADLRLSLFGKKKLFNDECEVKPKVMIQAKPFTIVKMVNQIPKNKPTYNTLINIKQEAERKDFEMQKRNPKVGFMNDLMRGSLIKSKNLADWSMKGYLLRKSLEDGARIQDFLKEMKKRLGK